MGVPIIEPPEQLPSKAQKVSGTVDSPLPVTIHDTDYHVHMLNAGAPPNPIDTTLEATTQDTDTVTIPASSTAFAQTFKFTCKNSNVQKVNITSLFNGYIKLRLKVDGTATGSLKAYLIKTTAGLPDNSEVSLSGYYEYTKEMLNATELDSTDKSGWKWTASKTLQQDGAQINFCVDDTIALWFKNESGVPITLSAVTSGYSNGQACQKVGGTWGALSGLLDISAQIWLEWASYLQIMAIVSNPKINANANHPLLNGQSNLERLVDNVIEFSSSNFVENRDRSSESTSGRTNAVAIDTSATYSGYAIEQSPVYRIRVTKTATSTSAIWENDFGGSALKDFRDYNWTMIPIFLTSFSSLNDSNNKPALKIKFGSGATGSDVYSTWHIYREELDAGYNFIVINPKSAPAETGAGGPVNLNQVRRILFEVMESSNLATGTTYTIGYISRYLHYGQIGIKVDTEMPDVYIDQTLGDITVEATATAMEKKEYNSGNGVLTTWNLNTTPDTPMLDVSVYNNGVWNECTAVAIPATMYEYAVSGRVLTIGGATTKVPAGTNNIRARYYPRYTPGMQVTGYGMGSVPGEYLPVAGADKSFNTKVPQIETFGTISTASITRVLVAGGQDTSLAVVTPLIEYQARNTGTNPRAVVIAGKNKSNTCAIPQIQVIGTSATGGRVLIVGGMDTANLARSMLIEAQGTSVATASRGVIIAGKTATNRAMVPLIQPDREVIGTTPRVMVIGGRNQSNRAMVPLIGIQNELSGTYPRAIVIAGASPSHTIQVPAVVAEAIPVTDQPNVLLVGGRTGSNKACAPQICAQASWAGTNPRALIIGGRNKSNTVAVPQIQVIGTSGTGGRVLMVGGLDGSNLAETFKLEHQASGIGTNPVALIIGGKNKSNTVAIPQIQVHGTPATAPRCLIVGGIDESGLAEPLNFLGDGLKININNYANVQLITNVAVKVGTYGGTVVQTSAWWNISKYREAMLIAQVGAPTNNGLELDVFVETSHQTTPSVIAEYRTSDGQYRRPVLQIRNAPTNTTISAPLPETIMSKNMRLRIVNVGAHPASNYASVSIYGEAK